MILLVLFFYAFLQGIVLDVSAVIAKTPFCCNKASLGVLLITVHNKMTRHQLILDPHSIFVDFIFLLRYLSHSRYSPIFLLIIRLVIRMRYLLWCHHKDKKRAKLFMQCLFSVLKLVRVRISQEDKSTRMIRNVTNYTRIWTGRALVGGGLGWYKWKLFESV